MKKLVIRNFKCFSDIEIPLNNLTVFAGANGNGKSTAIQSLLFLRRTIEHCAKWEGGQYVMTAPGDLRVELNGSYCLALGTSSSILPLSSNSNKLYLGIIDGDLKFEVVYEIENDKLWLKPLEVMGGEKTKHFEIFYQEFYYLNAERIGPRLNQSIQFYDYPNTGHQGEYVAQLIGDTESNYQLKIEEDRRRPEFKSPRLEQQVNSWLDYLMPGVSVASVFDAETGFAQVKIENKFTKGNPVVAPNVGFGISYVLPIIVTSLIAKQGSYMIIENPEAHLHPSAQSRLGHFLAIMAQSGVKVIVETHSDHIVNGIQIAAASKKIMPKNVSINFFNQSQEIEEYQPSVNTININDLGELSKWPVGFFDQNQQDYRSLLKIRKGDG